ncbi:hypothetical protein N0V90_013532 [Kalmusia sp. IMI 367209]|nr:hypothetical protein N0V90_013532 [Kalmusia sp. IMI 367209]
MKRRMLLFFVFFLLLAGADAPDFDDEFWEAVLDRLDDRLVTIAGNVKPPLPVPLMAAAILVAILAPLCVLLPGRLAIAWGRLVRRANSFRTGQSAHTRCRWILGTLDTIVLWADGVFAPFKREDDWETRARRAERERDEAIAQRRDAEQERDQAVAKLVRVSALQQRMAREIADGQKTLAEIRAEMR